MDTGLGIARVLVGTAWVRFGNPIDPIEPVRPSLTILLLCVSPLTSLHHRSVSSAIVSSAPPLLSFCSVFSFPFVSVL
ncbi:hypothetical protein SESBI_34123 [Sesbania bispinosa]|nr:hypothetical protein SESBI_34123 [Sesbania bispinosa]